MLQVDGHDQSRWFCCPADFVPNLRPGIELTAGLLLLQPGADNLGFATTTTFLPIQNPQWAVQALNPAYQPGFTVGARYTWPCSGRVCG